MPRKPRIQQQSICYHVFNRGINKQAIFRDEVDRQTFTDLVLRYKARCDARVYHWAWMGNHYHMLVEVQYDLLQLFCGGVQQSYAQYFHKRHGTCGTFWQDRFKSPPVENTREYMGRCGRYIERNPVLAGVVQHAWDYPWSSAAFYVNARKDEITDANPYTGSHKMTKLERRVYRDALASAEDDALFSENDREDVIGSAVFTSRFRIQNGRHRRKCGRRRMLE